MHRPGDRQTNPQKRPAASAASSAATTTDATPAKRARGGGRSGGALARALEGLSASQKRVIEAVRRKDNVFITGGAGTGKTFLLNAIRELLAVKERPALFSAPTGLAAHHIRGETIHSLLGIFNPDVEIRARQIAKRNKTGDEARAMDAMVTFEIMTPAVAAECARYMSDYARERWRNADVLVIDEASMVDARTLDVADRVARVVRNVHDLPFGGLQLILCGDFFQLPPVRRFPASNHSKQQQQRNPTFDARPWERNQATNQQQSLDRTALASEAEAEEQNDRGRFCFFSKVWAELNPTIFRLEEVFRHADPAFAELMLRLRRGVLTPEDVRALRARHPQRQQNTQQSQQAEGSQQQQQQIRPTLLSAKKDLTKHLNENALRELSGAVVEFPCRFNNAVRSLVPLQEKTWMCRIERNTNADPILRLRVGAQVMCLANLREHGLQNGSRGVVTGFQSLQIGGSGSNDRSLSGRAVMITVPVVQFRGKPDPIPIKPHTWRIPGVRQQITQIPLTLGYALTIHKAQGLTLDLLHVDLDRVFEAGHVYVALSRATGFDGLTLENLDPALVRADTSVLLFDQLGRAPTRAELRADEERRARIRQQLHDQRQRNHQQQQSVGANSAPLPASSALSLDVVGVSLAGGGDARQDSSLFDDDDDDWRAGGFGALERED